MTSTTITDRHGRWAMRYIVGSAAIVGSVLIATGVWLPWLTFFAGLQGISGAGTTNGTLLLAMGIAAGATGILLMARPHRWVRRVLTGLGLGLVALVAYLAVQLIATYRAASADPLLVAQLGPGLGIAAAGAILVMATAFLGDEARDR